MAIQVPIISSGGLFLRIQSGDYVDPATLGSGTPNSSTFLRGDNTWASGGTTDWANPGTIGSTTPNTGKFTTLDTTGNVTLGDATTDTLNVGNGGIIKNASGHTGIGVTPPAWNTAFDVLSVGLGGIASSGNAAYMGNNAYYDAGGAWRYAADGYAALFLTTDDRIEFYGAASGTAGGAITPLFRWGTETTGCFGIQAAPSSSACLTLGAGVTSRSSLRMGHGSAPTSPVDGDFWTTTAGVFTRVNGATVGPLATIDYAYCGFRLTLTTTVPVTTADVTAATTLYCTPYWAKANRIALYNGSVWVMRTSAQFSIAVPATTNTMYDVFCYDNAGTPTLELTAWTNDTTRATGLTLQDGVLVKTGAVTRRYLGSFRTTGVSGQTEDSYVKRYVYNYYNRFPRPLRRIETTSSWNYTTAAWRQANNSSANQVDFVVGVPEELVEFYVVGSTYNATSSSAAVGIGIDSTTALATGCLTVVGNVLAGAGEYAQLTASLRTYVSAGRHYATWIEYGGGTGTNSWYGTAGVSAAFQAGINGIVWG